MNKWGYFGRPENFIVTFGEPYALFDCCPCEGADLLAYVLFLTGAFPLFDPYPDILVP